jgi:hypothetical protein
MARSFHSARGWPGSWRARAAVERLDRGRAQPPGHCDQSSPVPVGEHGPAVRAGPADKGAAPARGLTHPTGERFNTGARLLAGGRVAVQVAIGAGPAPYRDPAKYDAVVVAAQRSRRSTLRPSRGPRMRIHQRIATGAWLFAALLTGVLALVVAGCTGHPAVKGGGPSARPASAGASGGAVISPGTATASFAMETRTGEASFMLPSRNIGCAMTAEAARCDILNRNWTPPPRPASCPRDHGDTGGTRVRARHPGCGVRLHERAGRRALRVCADRPRLHPGTGAVHHVLTIQSGRRGGSGDS